MDIKLAFATAIDAITRPPMDMDELPAPKEPDIPAPDEAPAAAYGDDLEGWIRQAMAIRGVDESWFPGLLSRAIQESGGNPRAQNNWDSNAAAGIPSKGLMQTIDPTFNAYKMPGYDDIWDPVANLVAAIGYIQARYGHPDNLPSGGY